ncbi:MAG: YeiH family protein [Ancalomicrobiaceae bacterium]|nr:YeiH family protein [Ancalomicrobiaceae bacterium]
MTVSADTTSVACPVPAASRSGLSALSALMPGLGLAVAVAVAAYALRFIPGVATFSPMILAILIGAIWRNTIGTPESTRAGISFSLKRLLRLAVMLLGLQLTLAQVAEVGVAGMAVIILTLVSTFLATKWVGRLMGVERQLAELIAAGTSICGASAIVATNSVTEADDEDVAYAVACVTVFGTIAMFVYPLLQHATGLGARGFGLWAGASIHEVAQVVGAAFAGGDTAGQFGTVAKLSRVLMLAPLVLSLGFVARRNSTGEGPAAKVPVPWFVVGFVALVILNSVMPLPASARPVAGAVTTFLLTVALAAMGLETHARRLLAKGIRPFLLGAFAAAFIACTSLVLIKLLWV